MCEETAISTGFIWVNRVGQYGRDADVIRLRVSNSDNGYRRILDPIAKLNIKERGNPIHK